jgi:hypothetical protein
VFRASTAQECRDDPGPFGCDMKRPGVLE